MLSPLVIEEQGAIVIAGYCGHFEGELPGVDYHFPLFFIQGHTVITHQEQIVVVHIGYLHGEVEVWERQYFYLPLINDDQMATAADGIDDFIFEV